MGKGKEKKKEKFSGIIFKLCMCLNTCKSLVMTLDCKETEHKEVLFLRMTKTPEVLCSDTSTSAEQNSIAALHIQHYKEKRNVVQKEPFLVY